MQLTHLRLGRQRDRRQLPRSVGALGQLGGKLLEMLILIVEEPDRPRGHHSVLAVVRQDL